MAIVATGIGFSAFTLAVWVVSRANPLVIWWWNHRNHARFYVVAPKSYLAWVAINPIELVVALGLPSAVLAAVGFSMRKAPRSAWAALLVIALLNLSGKNLSEVARLWLPLIPGLLAASAAGIARIGGKSGSLAALILFVGVQTVALESMVQVVYPMEMP